MSRLSGVIDLASLLILAGALGLGVWLGFFRSEAVEVTGLETGFGVSDLRWRSQLLELAANGNPLGPQGAKASLLVFSDYSCSFSREFARDLDSLQRRLPQHLGVTVKQFAAPSSSLAFGLAMGAKCAGKMALFDRYHEAMIRPVDTSPRWQAFAEQLDKAEASAFAECVESAVSAADATRDYADGVEVGVSGTPTFFLNGARFEGVPETAELIASLKEALGR